MEVLSRWDYKYTRPPSFSSILLSSNFDASARIFIGDRFIPSSVRFAALSTFFALLHCPLPFSIFHRCPFLKLVTPFGVSRWNYKYIEPSFARSTLLSLTKLWCIVCDIYRRSLYFFYLFRCSSHILRFITLLSALLTNFHCSHFATSVTPFRRVSMKL